MRTALFMCVLAAGCGAVPRNGATQTSGDGGVAEAAAPSIVAPAPPPEPEEIDDESHDAEPTDASDAPATSSYRVIARRAGVVSNDRAPGCDPMHASCDLAECFRVSPSRSTGTAPSAALRCDTDTDCALVQTECCSGGADLRALRTDAAADWQARRCGEAGVCTRQPLDLTRTTMRAACVESRCEVVDSVPTAWCDEPSAPYTVLRAGDRPAHARHDDRMCELGTCLRRHGNCFRAVTTGPPHLPRERTRCSRDSECEVRWIPTDDDPCGSSTFRALRVGARASMARGRGPVACPAVARGVPGMAACVEGTCQLVEPRPETECSTAQ